GSDNTSQSNTETQDSQTVAGSETAQETDAQEAMRAVYLENGNGNMFVSIEQETPFTGTLPEDISDEDGNAITADDLNNGDVVDIYGDGIMLNSYPGQYPGISKLVRVE